MFAALAVPLARVAERQIYKRLEQANGDGLAAGPDTGSELEITSN